MWRSVAQSLQSPLMIRYTEGVLRSGVRVADTVLEKGYVRVYKARIYFGQRMEVDRDLRERFRWGGGVEDRVG